MGKCLALAVTSDRPSCKADAAMTASASFRMMPRPRHELLKLNRYLFKAAPVQASRGCPYRCSFCEIPVFYDGAYRTRPIEDIVEEIKQVVKITGWEE